jgi:hypothetical protein
MDEVAGVRQRFSDLERVLDEKSRRLLVAAESKALGRGGISAVAKATGVSRQVIRQGVRELGQSCTPSRGRIRRPGGGRKKNRQKDPTLVADLEKIIGAEYARRSGVLLALDLQEFTQVGRGVGPYRA